MAGIVLIFGRRGCGKTTLARRLASAYPRPRVLAHDPMAEFEYDPIEDDRQAEDIPPGTLIVADEIDLIAPPSGWRTAWIRSVAHYGRHLDITLVGCSRRPANVHRDLTALASDVYLGRVTEPRDIEYCAAAWGEACYRAASLPPFRFLHIRP